MARNKSNAEVNGFDNPTTASEFAGSNVPVAPTGAGPASVDMEIPDTLDDEDEARALSQLARQAKADTDASRSLGAGSAAEDGEDDYGIDVMLSANGRAVFTVQHGVKQDKIQAIRKAIDSVMNG